MPEKIPFRILIVVALEPRNWLDNQQFYRHVLADELRKTALLMDFKNSLSFVTIPSSITTTLLKINILFKYPSDAFADINRVNILEFMLTWFGRQNLVLARLTRKLRRVQPVEPISYRPAFQHDNFRKLVRQVK
jgi:hypothetical protein